MILISRGLVVVHMYITLHISSTLHMYYYTRMHTSWNTLFFCVKPITSFSPNKPISS
jgi:hypothetical protein